MSKEVPLASSDKDEKKKYITYTHRQELEVLAERNVPIAIEKLAPLSIPFQYNYIWNHFWSIYECLGQDFTLSELNEYSRTFAPTMCTPDKLILIKLRNEASHYVEELKDSEG